MERTKNELDLELKIRMMRFLWSTGYFVRRNIPLIRYEFGKKTNQQYTDVDVLGIKFDFNLNPHITICDCKSGSSTKTSERIFWLSGVMKYFNADHGFFVRSNVMESRYIDLANKLEILPLSLNQISELEKSYRIDANYYLGSFDANNTKTEDNKFRGLESLESRVHDYIRIKYWTDPVYQQIESLMSYALKIKKSDMIKEEQKLFLQMYILSLLSISILNFSRMAIAIPQKQREDQIKDRISGGRFESYERKKLLESFYDFMSHEIKLKYNQNYSVTKKEFLSQFYPPYIRYLVDLVQRICLNPKYAVSIPQILDLLTYQVALTNKGFDIKDIPNLSNNNDFYNFIKPAKDMITFGERSGLLSEEQSKTIKDALSKLDNPQKGKYACVKGAPLGQN